MTEPPFAIKKRYHDSHRSTAQHKHKIKHDKTTKDSMTVCLSAS